MKYKRKEVIGDATLYLADCMDVMPHLEKVDAVVTDPPYGIGIDGQKEVKKGKKSDRKGYDFKGWDNKTPEKVIFDEIFEVSRNQIIWGANYFQDKINHCGRMWLFWDKDQHGLTMSDGELAYTNMNKPMRVFKKNRAVLSADGAVHPTQKPVELMKWCISHLPEDSKTILDPFMGSGTTGVAALSMGRKFIGIELDEEYFDIACERIRNEYNQIKLF
jgi:site-specific DNA-methyltransferase (adenine-specific)